MAILGMGGWFGELWGVGREFVSGELLCCCVVLVEWVLAETAVMFVVAMTLRSCRVDPGFSASGAVDVKGSARVHALV